MVVDFSCLSGAVSRPASARVVPAVDRSVQKRLPITTKRTFRPPLGTRYMPRKRVSRGLRVLAHVRVVARRHLREQLALVLAHGLDDEAIVVADEEDAAALAGEPIWLSAAMHTLSM